MKPILIVKTGGAARRVREAHGDFDEMILSASGLKDHEARVVAVYQGEVLPEPEAVSGVIITGSPAMVTDREPWSTRLEEWVLKAHHSGVPVLGICYGHQLLGQAFGGSVGYHPDGMELGMVRITVEPAGQQDRLFGMLPGSFQANVIHSQTVLQLPQGAVRLAGNPYEPNHGFRIGETTWGVQFHPEFSADIMRDYIRLEAEDRQMDAGWCGKMLEQVTEQNCGKRLFSAFVAVCRQMEQE